MDKLLAWAIGISLAVGIGALTNVWLGITAGGVWAFYLRRKAPEVGHTSTWDSRAYAMKEWVEHAKGPVPLLGAMILATLFVDATLGDSYRQYYTGWRSAFTWRFLQIVVAAVVCCSILRLLYLFVFILWAHIRYPKIHHALPLVDGLVVHDGVLGWAELHLNMTPLEAADVIGDTSLSEPYRNGSRRMDGRYRDRFVYVYWSGPLTERIQEISLWLKPLEESMEKSWVFPKILKRLPFLEERDSLLLLDADDLSAILIVDDRWLSLCRVDPNRL